MDLRSYAKEIFKASLKAVDPYEAVKDHAELIRRRFKDGGFERLVAVGMGKASGEMARALHDSLGDLVSAGIVVTKHGAARLSEGKTGPIRILEGGHPLPDEDGVSAAREIVQLLSSEGERTLVVCLASGGGSALLAAPYEGISLEEKQSLTQALLRAGADINELNAVRKHISAVKGGRLARLSQPATVISLIVSDVISDPLSVIASGPTAPDESTYAQAVEVLDKYQIQAPASITEHLASGQQGNVPETPKLGDPVFEHVENLIIANNSSALEAARQKAESYGFKARILTDRLQGDVASAAAWLYEKSQELLGENLQCLISGGETTVIVTGNGLGGRNMELALRFGLLMEGREDLCMLSAGTDGTDGPTDAAGAIVDGTSMSRARDNGIDPTAFLENNDSYHFFQRAGGLLITGPTGTNVMDVQVVLAGNARPKHA